MRTLGCGLLVASLLIVISTEVHANVLVGSSYNVAIINGPDGNLNTPVTLDLTTKLLSSNLTITEKLFADGPDSQWIELEFRTVNGGALAANLNGNWRFDVSGIDVDTPSLGSGFYYYWSDNGTPFSAINNFGGFGGIAPIPTNPSAGPAYTAIGFPPFSAPDFGAFAFVNPYNFISVGGMNPNTADGFHIGIRITNANPTIPEPTSLSVLSLGTLAMVSFGWRRRNLAC